MELSVKYILQWNDDQFQEDRVKPDLIDGQWHAELLSFDLKDAEEKLLMQQYKFPKFAWRLLRETTEVITQLDAK